MELHHPAIGLNLYNLFLDRYLGDIETGDAAPSRDKGGGELCTGHAVSGVQMARL